MEIIFLDPEGKRCFADDSSRRFVRGINFICPCGKSIILYVTKSPHFYLTPDPDKFPKAWHYEITGDRVSITPSIDLTFRGQSIHHRPECHLTITDVPFREEYDEKFYNTMSKEYLKCAGTQ